MKVVVRFVLGFVLGFVLVLAGAARADVIPALFGSPIPLDAKSAGNVVLENEEFRAQIFTDYATATATYRFRNQGRATTVTMAFPEAGPPSGYNYEKPGFADFRIRVDGRAIPVRQLRTKSEYDQTILRRTVKISFQRNQTRTIELRCRTREFESLLFGANLHYLFGGAKWKGDTRSAISVTFRAPGAYVVNAYQGTSDFLEEKDLTHIVASNATCSFQSARELQGQLLFSITPTLVADWLTLEGADAYERTVMVPGEAQGLSSAAFWLPPALIRNGVTYVRLDHFTNYGFDEGAEKNAAQLSWDKKTSTALLRAYGHKLEVTKNSLNARIDGRPFRLRGKPFTAEELGHDIGSNTPIYAPLLDVARALGGSANVNAKAHRFYIALPKPSRL